MAGRVRQPIDIKALEDHLRQNVPEIKTPLDVKQVRREREGGGGLNRKNIMWFLN